MNGVSRKQQRRRMWIGMLALAVPVIWLALLIAPCTQGGVTGIVQGFSDAVAHPFRITLCPESGKTVLVCLAVYGFAALYYASTVGHHRRGEEHGSADWDDARAVNRKYHQEPFKENKIFTQNVKIGLNGIEHQRNLHSIIVGGSGSGKTRFYAKPNLMQANTSFVVTDPKGELLRSCGELLESEGYHIKVLDLLHMSKSHCYNPFCYLQTENDVQQLVTNLFKATTTKKESGSMDPFWEDMAQMYLLALMFYLLEEAPPEEQNFATVLELVRNDKVVEEESVEGEKIPSPVETLFYQLELTKPDSTALKYYKDFKVAAGKTLKSIQSTLISHLNKFNLTEVAALTRTDEMELDRLGRKKTVIFAVIPDNDKSFNFLVSILYTQMFQQLFRVADDEYGGALPMPVHFLMDEFANVALPDDFETILSVMRSRNVFVSIILQNMAQIKALFKDSWESIVGNCDEFLYLGGNEQSTHEYISKMLGKETIDTNTYGISRGRNGSYSKNDQNAGRELLTLDEVRMLDNKYALLFIRGERPVKDLKYKVLKHPNIRKTTDGGAAPFIHGQVTRAVCDLSVEPVPGRRRSNLTGQPKGAEESSAPLSRQYELLSETDVEELFKEENFYETV